MTKQEAEENVDKAIRSLWLAFRDLSDFVVSSDDIKLQDLLLWEAVTNHPAVQTRLDKAK